MQTKSLRQQREEVERTERRLDDLSKGIYMGRYHKDIEEKIYYFTQVYFKMPEYERVEHRQAWDAYYAACKQTPEYRLFCEVKKAFADKNMVVFSELLGTVREQLKAKRFTAVPKPAGFDPVEWDHADWAGQYRALQRKLEGYEYTDPTAVASTAIAGGTW